jgi:predicted O-methyltransferase YrrM
LVSAVRTLWQKINKLSDPSPRDEQEFRRRFARNFETCRWQPHPLYSVFTQYDQEYYLSRREVFLHKYRCFYAVSKTIRPKKILELGTSAGSSADAYLSATPTASYVGFDSFGKDFNHVTQEVWDPYEIATKLFALRGFKDYELIQIDLRRLERLPHKGDLVVVDAGHDYENEYKDLQLALTAEPRFIFIDDAEGQDGVALAIEDFLNKDIADRIDFTVVIDYLGGGLVIKLKP